MSYRSTSNNGAWAGGLAVILSVLFAVGWIENVIKLATEHAYLANGAPDILRIAGIFVAPLGAVIGWL